MIPKQAIEKAIAGGWHGLTGQWQVMACDPSFWQALGKSCGWKEMEFYPYAPGHNHEGGITIPEARWRQRVFVNKLWEGGVKEFWEEILK